MLTTRALRVASVALAVGGSLAACRRPIPPGAVVPASDTAGAAASAQGTAASAAGDSTAAPADSAPSLDDENARATAELRNALLAPVYFEFDQADLSDQTRAALEQKAAVMRRYPSVTVRIAGHTDSRGSDEYNLALGQRRGSIVKRYMIERGIAGGRLEVVSYGEERPAAEGDDEAARSQNRRAEFEIMSGANFSQPSSPPSL